MAAPARADRARVLTGSNPGSKLGADESNSDELESAPDGSIRSHTARTFRLGAGRSQVQILSPRLELPANRRTMFVGRLAANGTGSNFGERAGTWSMAPRGGLRARATARFFGVIFPAAWGSALMRTVV